MKTGTIIEFQTGGINIDCTRLFVRLKSIIYGLFRNNKSLQNYDNILKCTSNNEKMINKVVKLEVKMKTAFTMAEVLITIGIIGVVAAMTLPSLISKHQKTELETALKKNYSVMQQALLKMQAENAGVPPSPKIYSRQEFKDLYIKQFNVLIDCGFGSSDVTDKENAAEFCVTEQLDDSNQRYTDHYKTFNKKSQIDNTLINNGQFVLTDGSIIFIENWDTGRIYISVDVNGIKKSPNIWGHDLFTFQLMDDGRLAPMGMEGTAYSEDGYCSKTSTNKFNGVGCTSRALNDKKYWDILQR